MIFKIVLQRILKSIHKLFMEEIKYERINFEYVTYKIFLYITQTLTDLLCNFLQIPYFSRKMSFKNTQITYVLPLCPETRLTYRYKSTSIVLDEVPSRTCMCNK